MLSQQLLCFDLPVIAIHSLSLGFKWVDFIIRIEDKYNILISTTVEFNSVGRNYYITLTSQSSSSRLTWYDDMDLCHNLFSAIFEYNVGPTAIACSGIIPFTNPSSGLE